MTLPSQPRLRIRSTGMFVPDKVVTNGDLERLMDTSDEWIQQRSGIKERRQAPEGIGSSDLALEASKHALRQANLCAEDLDFIIVATLSPDCAFPGTSSLLQHKLGLTKTPAMDIRCQCSGFLYSLQVANALITSGTYHRILIVGAETHSPMLNYNTEGRDVTVLFGDGAGAVIVEGASDEDCNAALLKANLYAQGEHAKKLWMERPGAIGGQTWISDDHVKHLKVFPQMEGRFVFKNAVSRMKEVITEILEQEDLTVDEIHHFLFHQANLRINESVATMLGIDPEKSPSNIEKYGNCSSASIPMLLDESIKSGKIQRGDLVCMTGFGSGFTWGSAILRY